MVRAMILVVVLTTAVLGFMTGPCVSTPPPPPQVTEAQLQQIAASLQMYVDELPEIPRLYGYSWDSNGVPVPGNLTIGMYEKKWKFHRDFPPTTVFAYGTSAEAATVPGPIIEALRNTRTLVTWLNFLPQKHILPFDTTIPTAIPKNGGVPTVVHLHGAVDPADSDGSAFAWYTSNFGETGPKWTQATYTYPNVQHSGNLWYHDHALGLTRVNLLAGLVGIYRITDPVFDHTLNLPSGPEFDRHLMVFDRSFYMDGSLYMNATGDNPSIHPQWQPEYFGDAIIVNGKAWPYLEVQRRKYRFRIINSSNARFFNFTLSNGMPFTIIGSDASYLPSPVTTPSFLLAPSEIADVIVDFSLASVKEIILNNNAAYPFPGGDAVDNLNGQVMKFVVTPGNPSPPDNSVVPNILKNYVPTTMTSSVTRYIVLYEYDSATGNPTHLFINGKSLTDPVTETPKSGSTEIWHVINLTPDNHPLHLHLAYYQALKVQQLVDLDNFTNCMTQKNDAVACNVSAHATGPVDVVPANERTWKNVVKIKPGYQTTVIVKFNLVENDAPYPFDATKSPGYVYHCHILDHEDNEMIRPLQPVP
ncbi:hypothetical protein MLD38_031593 [Melastoma candidum]|uniref:Uncharacterized protein n=1 Tax=Melastoma candidum TaxID=119954 RepID=A0ACB9MPM4_9MYRT|nr:hypothetical protein MLD38_031593 [Melastoma candidum]